MWFKKNAYIILLMCVFAVICGCVETIYFDDFDGWSSMNLHGLSPDIDNSGGDNSWIAHQSWKASGIAGSHSSATLPFTPKSGYIYQLSATLWDVEGGDYWLALGFTEGSSTGQGENGDRFISSPTSGNPWMLRRGDAATSPDQLFLGPGTANVRDFDPLDRSKAVDFRIQLDTRQENWKARWYHKLVSQTYYRQIHSQQYSTNPSIAAVGLASSESSDEIRGRFIDFTLEKIRTSLAITEDGNPEDVTINEGRTAYLYVKCTSDSTPVAIWHRIVDSQDSIVDGSDPHIYIGLRYDSQSEVYTSALRIANTSRDDEGWYYCILNNNEDFPVTSAQAYLETKDLVSHWPLDADEYLNGQYVDIKGGHNATVTGTPDFVDGICGIADNAVNINPSNGWATSGDFGLTSGTNKFTISIWFNWQGPVSGDADDLLIVTALGGTANLGDMTDSIGRWRHLRIAYDGLKGRMYLDGRKVYDEYWPVVDLGDLLVQIGHDDGDESFNGAIDDIKLYDFVLDGYWHRVFFTKGGDCKVLYLILVPVPDYIFIDDGD